MGKPSAQQPAVPNVGQEVQAQQQSNLQTAQLNNANQVTPYGSLNYQYDPASGQFTATQQLSQGPQSEQANLNRQLQGQQTYANSVLSMLNAASPQLQQPINTNYEDVRQQYINSQMGLLQPQLDQQQQSLQSQLANQGITEGSNAYENAMRQFTQSQNQAYASILANAQTGVNQAIQGQTALRQEPLQEAQQLLSGGLVQQPTYAQTAQTAAPNVFTAYGQAQTQAEQNYQAALQQQQGLFGDVGGLFGTVAGASKDSLIGSWLSDERLKTDIKQVGSLMQPGGEEIPISTFRFKGDPVRRLGFVAQDVEDANPGAVTTHPSGFKGVIYGKVLRDAHMAAMAGGRR